MEDRIDHTETIDKEAVTKFGEGLDGRVLQKVIVALEARLTEHIGLVDRRLAEFDAQIALDLKAVDTHTAAQASAVEQAIQQIESQVRSYVTAAQQASADQIAGVDQRLSALHETLPAKFREIIEAVRQSMEARVALELTEIENRVKAGAVAPEKVEELETRLNREVAALSDKLSAELAGLAEQQQSQTEPLQQALQQLETRLNTLREELPPKIRQIVEAVEESMEARIAAGEERAAGRLATLEQALTALRDEMPSAGGFRQAIDESLQRHAEQVAAVDQKLTALQEELPTKIKGIVDALHESLEARMAAELQTAGEQHRGQIEQTESRLNSAHEQLRQELAAALKTRLDESDQRASEHAAAVEAHVAQMTAGVTSELQSRDTKHEQSVATLQADLAAMQSRLEETDRRMAYHATAVEQRVGQVSEGFTAELRQLEERVRADGPAKPPVEERSLELEKALQYAALLEARVAALEQQLAASAVEIESRAVERVWQALESRLQQHAPAPVAAAPAETVSDLRQRSTSAEQSVLDLIAGIGQLFEKPVPRAVKESAPDVKPEEPQPSEPVAAAPAEAEPAHSDDIEPPPPAPAAQAEEPPAPVDAAPPAEQAAGTPAALAAPVIVMPEPPCQEPPAKEPEAQLDEAAAAEETAGDSEQTVGPDGRPPVILFKPKEAGRKWRIPFVSSFLLMGIAVVWLQFM
ncbi:MAG TPA: hypothetical protein VMT86_12965 [Bryobacteraceae bacterium]|nr:hypothetical protein [Bryobacteraceae bacterium]